MDVCKLSRIDMLGLFGLLVPFQPEEHPDEAERTDDDECTLPSPCLGDERDGSRSSQCAYRSTAVEDCRGECTVLFREIFCRHLDGRGEVARLTNGQDHAAAQEEIYRNGRDRERKCGALLHGVECLHAVQTLDLHRQPSTSCMEAGTCRPDDDGEQIAFLCSQAVNGSTCEEAHRSIEQREPSRDHTIVAISPVKFRGDEVLPCQREHLTVEIVDRGGDEEKCTEIPSPVRLYIVFDSTSVHARCFLAF